MAVLARHGRRTHVFSGEERIVITVFGAPFGPHLLEALADLPGVERVAPLTSAYKLASRESHPDDSVVAVGSRHIGGGDFAVIAGPAFAVDPGQILDTALRVAAAGASALRGGPAYGGAWGEEEAASADALEPLFRAGQRAGLPVVAEVAEPADLAVAARFADALHIAGHDMQNRPLLRAAGRLGRPILLERSTSATVDEWLTAAEYVMHQGNLGVVLCESGIRTFEADRATTLDLSAVPVVKHRSHLPVVVNPGRATGHRHLVAAMALAAAAAGADGLVVDVHSPTEGELAEGPHSLTFDEFRELMRRLEPLVAALRPAQRRRVASSMSRSGPAGDAVSA